MYVFPMRKNQHTMLKITNNTCHFHRNSITQQLMRRNIIRQGLTFFFFIISGETVIVILFHLFKLCSCNISNGHINYLKCTPYISSISRKRQLFCCF